MKVFWSEDALMDMIRIKRYLLEEWSETIASKFIEEVEQKIDVVSKFPEIGREAKKGDLRKVIVSKRHWMYYRVRKNEIEIVNFFDQKWNPLKNKFE